MSEFDKYNKKYIDKCLLSTYEKMHPNVIKSNRKSRAKIYKNCYLLPVKYAHPQKEILVGGICNSEGISIEETKFFPNRVVTSYKFNREDAVIDEREVVFAGYFWPHWGHFILEQISRLYYFLEETDPSLPIVYLGTEKLSGNFLEFFELLGIDTNRLVWVNELTKFGRIIIPEPCVLMSNDTDKALWKKKLTPCSYTDEYLRIIETVKSKVEPFGEEYSKVFLTRKNFKKAEDKDFGAVREVENFFEKAGYKIISPEKLTVREQIGIMKACKYFAASSGTLPHNLIFAEPDTQAVIINKSYVINPHQKFIDKITSIKPVYIDAHLSMLPAHLGWGPFFYHVSDNLVNWAHDNGYEIEKTDPSKYIKEFIEIYYKNICEIESLYKINLKYRRLFDYYLKQIKCEPSLKFIISLTNKLPVIIYINRFIQQTKKALMVIKYKVSQLDR